MNSGDDLGSLDPGATLRDSRVAIALVFVVLLGLWAVTPIIEIEQTATATVTSEANQPQRFQASLSEDGHRIDSASARLAQGESLSMGPIVDSGDYAASAQGSSGARCHLDGDYAPGGNRMTAGGGDGCHVSFREAGRVLDLNLGLTSVRLG